MLPKKKKCIIKKIKNIKIINKNNNMINVLYLYTCHKQEYY